MIFQYFEIISTIGILIIAIQLILLVRLRYRESRLSVIRRTHEEIHKNYSNIQLLMNVTFRSKGTEWDEKRLNEEDQDFIDSVNKVLNYCEYLSIGIFERIFDERLIKASMGFYLLIVYSHFERNIRETRMRQNNPETFRYFSMLIEKWRVSDAKRPIR